MRGPAPDLVLSGVNRGQNLAEDVTMSGTVAGAIEGMALGVPVDRPVAGHDRLPRRGRGPLGDRRGLRPGHHPAPAGDGLAQGRGDERQLPATATWTSVNEVEVTRQGFRDFACRHTEKRTDLRGRDYYWMGFAAASRRSRRRAPTCGAIYEGTISVTPLHIDLTHTTDGRTT